MADARARPLYRHSMRRQRSRESPPNLLPSVSEPIEERRRFCAEAYEMNANRIRDIDFWRGAVLIAILIDHIPGNPLENWTPRNFGLSDSAEAFVFLSGLSVGLIYMPRALQIRHRAGRRRLPQARAQALWRAYRADPGRACGVRSGLLDERRAGPDPGAWTRFRLRLAGAMGFWASPCSAISSAISISCRCISC